MTINIWYQKHREDFFFYQKPNGAAVPFIMGIQTKWMLDRMVKLSNNSLIAMDLTFNTNKYGVSWMSMIDSIYLLKLHLFNIIDDLYLTSHVV